MVSEHLQISWTFIPKKEIKKAEKKMKKCSWSMLISMYPSIDLLIYQMVSLSHSLTLTHFFDFSLFINGLDILLKCCQMRKNVMFKSIIFA